jgi:hypothetical protein
MTLAFCVLVFMFGRHDPGGSQPGDLKSPSASHHWHFFSTGAGDAITCGK